MANTQGTVGIVFKPAPEAVVDAFTGGPLVGAVTRCAKCLCCYGAESLEALKDHNQGNCIGCGDLLATEPSS
ncbi:hypothetical protein D3C75_1331630 [compost metagenome]